MIAALASSVLIFLLPSFVIAEEGQDQSGLLQNFDGEIDLNASRSQSTEPYQPDPELQQKLETAAVQKGQNAKTLSEVNEAAVISSERQVTLGNSIAELQEKRKTLVRSLISTARDIQNLEDDVALTQRRLARLNERGDIFKARLIDEREVMSEVLAALQRIGRNPPPALFVRADDVLDSIRSAIVLGAVLPDLQDRAHKIVDNLEELARVRKQTEEQRERLIAQETELKGKQVNLDHLIKENQALKQKADEALADERRKGEILAAQAQNLKDLIARLDDEINAGKSEEVRRKELAALKVEEENRLREVEEERLRSSILALQPVQPQQASSFQQTAALNENTETRFPERVIVDYGSIEQVGNIAPGSQPFSQVRGLLNLPSRGVILTKYGEKDPNNKAAEGISIATRGNAPVVSPADGVVVFAGQFRTFRQLLIIDAGEGYHLVMAGMDRINVALGDRVAAGEPVATMGLSAFAGGNSSILQGTSPTNAKYVSGQRQQVLYVELRKNGKSIDSGPWWSS